MKKKRKNKLESAILQFKKCDNCNIGFIPTTQFFTNLCVSCENKLVQDEKEYIPKETLCDNRASH